jgi:HSP20 family molecular chaperone IbpA
MMISVSPPPVDSNPAESSETLLQTKLANPGADFSALLFLILGVPPGENVAAVSAPQIEANITCATCVSSGFDQSMLAPAQLSDSPGTGVASTPEQEQTPNDVIASRTQESLVGNLLPVTEPQAVIADFEVSPPVNASASPQEKSVTSDSAADAAAIQGNSVESSLISSATQRWVSQSEQTYPSVATSQNGSTPNPTLDSNDATSVTDSLRDVSDPTGAQNQSIATEPDDSGTKIAVASIIKNPANLASQTNHVISKDIELDKRVNVSGGIEKSVSDIVNGNLESAVGDPKGVGAQEQNFSFESGGHGEKTFSQRSGSNNDQSTEPANSSVVFPSINMSNAEISRTSEAKMVPAAPPLIDQVAEHIAANVQQNQHEAVITLDPPGLGRLKINLTLDGGKVHVNIVAEAHESRSLIETHLPELKQALQVHRLDLADVRVDSGSWNGTTGDLMQRFQREPNGREQPGWNSRNPSRPATETPESQRSDASPKLRGRVSMWA